MCRAHGTPFANRSDFISFDFSLRFCLLAGKKSEVITNSEFDDSRRYRFSFCFLRVVGSWNWMFFLGGRYGCLRSAFNFLYFASIFG
jgi:hypothetical protein